MKHIILVFLSIMISAVGQVLLKYGAVQSTDGETTSFLELYLNRYVLSGLVLYGASALLWIIALRKVELSYAYPMASLGYIIVFVASMTILGESINMTRVIGLFVILIGIVILARS